MYQTKFHENTDQKAFGFMPYDCFYATACGHSREGTFFQLDNGIKAYAIGGFPYGTRVLCSLRRLPRSAHERPMVVIETVLRYGTDRAA